MTESSEKVSFIDDIYNAVEIGVIGGTFDPVHYGHLAIAEAAGQQLGLDTVLFMPAGVPPFKQDRAVTPTRHRYAMLAEAVRDNPRFRVSRAELDKPGVSYTADTMRMLKESLPKGAKIRFIIGADAFLSVHKWKDAQELYKLVTFAVLSRPGTDISRLKQYIRVMKDENGVKAKLINAPAIDISATELRERVARGESIKYLLPEGVREYIQINGLYSPKLLTEDAEKRIISRLKRELAEKRFAHTISAANEARRLAAIHGADTDKAYIAGLLHDCAKGMSEAKLLEYAAKNDIGADAFCLARPKLLHAAAGAHMAQHSYGIADPDILNAIRFHTTGRPNMSLLEKIVCIADYIEPLRENYGGLAPARAFADSDLDAALIAAFSFTIAHEGANLHPISVHARDYLICRASDGIDDF